MTFSLILSLIILSSMFTVVVAQCPDSYTVASSTTNVLCHGGGDGSATVVATGGTAPYTFRWDDVDQQTTATASNLPVGDYNCLVTDSNGCVATANVAISQPSLLTVSAGADQWCFSSPCNNCGQATVYNITGGTAPFSYLWDDAQAQTTDTAYNLDVGDLVVTLGDGNGCVATAHVTISQPLTLPPVSAGANHDVCSGDSVTLSASGASTYAWDNAVTDGTAFTPTATATYTVTGKGSKARSWYDTRSTANGCDGTDTVVVTVNTLPIVDAGADQAVCSGGSVTLSASGASTYAWDNGITDGTAFTPTATATYTVTGTDGNGCDGTDTVVVTVKPTVSAGADQRVCSGDSVTLSASGASTYTWDNGITDSVAFTPASTVTYTVTGTDGNGCIGTDTVVVELLSSWLCSCVTALESNNCVKLRECYNTAPCGCGSLDTTCISYRTAYEAVHCCVTPRHSQIFF
jgi:hypothetical protein